MLEINVPYFPREDIKPPGLLDRYGHLNPEDSLQTLKTSPLSQGAADLLKGLLVDGGVRKFPGGMGLYYETVFKRVYDTTLAKPALEEIANSIRDRVDVIVVPERSAVVPGAQLAGMLNVPVLFVSKNGDFNGDNFCAKVDSYTNKGKDLFQISPDHIAALGRKTKGKVRLWVHDEMIDTGAMIKALDAMVKQMKEAGFEVELVGASALIEKTYTEASNKILKALGIAAFGILQIEDLGLEPVPWIKVKGIDKALTFSP